MKTEQKEIRQDELGRKLCTARVKTCKNEACRQRFTKEDTGYECPGCGADRHCERWATKGVTVCQVHGSGSRNKKRFGGVPDIKRWKYDRSLNVPLGEVYARMQEREDWLALKNEIALVDTRIDTALNKIENEGGGLGDWVLVKRLLKEAKGAGTEEERNAALDELLRNVNIWQEGINSWEHLRAFIEQRRKLVHTETRRLIEANEVLTMDEAMLMLGKIRTILLKHLVEGEVISKGMLLEIRQAIMEASYVVPPNTQIAAGTDSKSLQPVPEK